MQELFLSGGHHKMQQGGTKAKKNLHLIYIAPQAKFAAQNVLETKFYM